MSYCNNIDPFRCTPQIMLMNLVTLICFIEINITNFEKNAHIVVKHSAQLNETLSGWPIAVILEHEFGIITRQNVCDTKLTGNRCQFTLKCMNINEV
jgi:hypothetical protein